MSQKYRIYIYPKEPSATFRVYEIITGSGSVPPQNLEQLKKNLFIDPIIEETRSQPRRLLEENLGGVVWFKRGIYDAEGEMALYAARHLGLARNIEEIRYGRGYAKTQSPEELFNPLVETLELLNP